jgi:outer membrane protein TolC
VLNNKKLKMRIFVFGLLACIYLATNSLSYAQENASISFSLQEAQDYALENNISIKNAKLDIASAKKKVWETTAMGLPQASASLDYQYIPGDIPAIDFGSDMAGLFEYLFTSLTELGYPPPEDMGGDMFGGPSEIAVKSSATYSATVSQLVFSGEYIVGLQAAKTYLQLSQNNLETTVLDVKESVATGYFGVLALERIVQILDTSISNFSVVLEEMKAMGEVGFLEDTEVDQIQLTLNTYENQKRTMERTFEISKWLLKIQLGMPQAAEFELTETMEDLMNNLSIMSVPGIGFEIEDNLTYKSLQTAERASELLLRREQTTYLPSIAAFYNYMDKTEKADFDFTINHIIGVTVSIPIFSSGMRNARVQQAKFELQKASNTISLLEETLPMQFEQMTNSYLDARENYLVQSDNIELSKRIYNKTTIKHKEGMASSMELTEAHGQLLNAQSTLINTSMELLNSKIALEKLLNNL